MLVDLLFIPGMLCDDGLWTAQAEALADVACGRTCDLAAYDSIGAMAQGVLRQAPDEFALAGFSMGGCVALEIVARAPRRVSRLALLDTSAAGLLPAVRQHYHQWIARIEAGGLEAYLADAFPRYVAPGRANDKTLRETFVTMGRRVGAAAAVRQMRALLDYAGFSGELAKINRPTVLICGNQDHRTPVAIHEEMAARIGGSVLTVIQGSGHFTPLEQPAAVTAALRQWLQMPVDIDSRKPYH